MTTHLPTVEREAAQIAIALRDLGHLSAKPTAQQVTKACAVFESHHGLQNDMNFGF